MYYTTANKEYIPVYRPNLSTKKTEAAVQSLEARVANFDEVILGYTLDQAMEEASRCLKCPARYCAANCPAHVQIPEFIALVRAGELEAAYQLISQSNCLPGATGRVCPQECQCEQHCTRTIKGEAVAIGRLEAFVADWHQTHGLPKEPKQGNIKGHVAVVGSGPSGLACAEALARAGVSVTILEAEEKLGGVLAYGIPGFALPATVLEYKLGELRALGVAFHTKQRITSAGLLLDKGYDAVFLGIGAGSPIKTGLEGEFFQGVLTAKDYLAAIREERQLPVAQTVVVLGGGNTAVDAARCARRMGALQVKIVYRRTQADMPARREELERALEEGVELVTQATPVRFVGERGTVNAVECARTEPNGPMSRTRKNFHQIPDSGQLIPAQLVILALGFRMEGIDGVELTDDGFVKVAQDGVSTSRRGIYAAGDAVTGPDSLVHAMAGGRRAAEAILQQLSEM